MVLLTAHSKDEVYAALKMEPHVLRCRITPHSLSWVTYLNADDEVVYCCYDPDDEVAP